jgi:predicted RNA binding protein YcfA (HicA-like mRNA interferase family)
LAWGRRLPPLTANDLKCVIKADGWYEVKGTKHLAFEHATKRGKVNIDAKWKHIQPGGPFFRSVLRQARLTKKEFERLYWKSCR